MLTFSLSLKDIDEIRGVNESIAIRVFSSLAIFINLEY